MPFWTRTCLSNRLPLRTKENSREGHNICCENSREVLVSRIQLLLLVLAQLRLPRQQPSLTAKDQAHPVMLSSVCSSSKSLSENSSRQRDEADSGRKAKELGTAVSPGQAALLLD